MDYYYRKVGLGVRVVAQKFCHSIPEYITALHQCLVYAQVPWVIQRMLNQKIGKKVVMVVLWEAKNKQKNDI